MYIRTAINDQNGDISHNQNVGLIFYGKFENQCNILFYVILLHMVVWYQLEFNFDARIAPRAGTNIRT